MKDLTAIETKGVFAAKGNPLTLLGNQIKVGDVAPEIVASDNTLADV